MRRYTRSLGTVLVVTGAAMLLWAFVVWAWQDPFTNIYTRWEQHRLAQSYDKQFAAYRPVGHANASLAAAKRELRVEAKRYRASARQGEAIGRISVSRMGIDMVLVNGTDHASLTKGPGRDLRTAMPGEGKLVYVAGHRTTYLAPFSHMNTLTALSGHLAIKCGKSAINRGRVHCAKGHLPAQPTVTCNCQWLKPTGGS